jgi:hypothetical protein
MHLDDPRLAPVHAEIRRLAELAGDAARRNDTGAFKAALAAHGKVAQRLADATRSADAT